MATPWATPSPLIETGSRMIRMQTGMNAKY